MKCIKYLVEGRVQGVFYRASTVDFVKGSGLGLTGYVRNLPDGNVEVLAQGKEEDLNELFVWLKKGPDMAKVSSVQCSELDHFDVYDDFNVSY